MDKFTTKEAYAMGQKAYEKAEKEGKPIASAQDKNLMTRLEALPRGKMGYLLPYLNAWNKGYHDALNAKANERIKNLGLFE